MNELMPLFSHPVLALDDYPERDAIADAFRAKALSLLDEYPDAGLIGDAWHEGRRAASRDDFARHGFTSFYNVNLGKRADFDFINQGALSAFRRYLQAVGRSDVSMRLDNAWASVYGRGHFVPAHTHPMSHLSLVFYASATEGTGRIVFDNPARGHFQHFYPPEVNWMQYRYAVQPRKGMFLVFPSYLSHHTEPHESEEPRIVYSANAQLRFLRSTDADAPGEDPRADAGFGG
jgi:uncharacterized protein (TIGR02466 family)